VVGGDGGPGDQLLGPQAGHPLLEPGGERIERGLLGQHVRAQPGGVVVGGVGGDEGVEVGVDQPGRVEHGVGLGDHLLERGKVAVAGTALGAGRDPAFVVEGPQAQDRRAERLVGGGELA